MKKFLFLATIAATFALASCDEVSESERFTYKPLPQVNRAVLIEDFTGQRCVNCPDAADEIHALQEQYGDSVVIGVGIHSGKFAKTASGRPYSLYTTTGDEYYNYWNIESQPMGVVNRMSGAATYQTWAAFVRNYLEQKSDVAISAEVSYDEATSKATITTTMLGSAAVTGKLQLWVIEDSIQDFQDYPSGRVYDYVHMHVFRDAVNGTWGEDVTIPEGGTITSTHEYTLNSEWVPEHCSIVAFVYNAQGVQNVTKVVIKK